MKTKLLTVFALLIITSRSNSKEIITGDCGKFIGTWSDQNRYANLEDCIYIYYEGQNILLKYHYNNGGMRSSIVACMCENGVLKIYGMMGQEVIPYYTKNGQEVIVFRGQEYFKATKSVDSKRDDAWQEIQMFRSYMAIVRDSTTQAQAKIDAQKAVKKNESIQYNQSTNIIIGNFQQLPVGIEKDNSMCGYYYDRKDKDYSGNYIFVENCQKDCVAWIVINNQLLKLFKCDNGLCDENYRVSFSEDKNAFSDDAGGYFSQPILSVERKDGKGQKATINIRGVFFD